MKKFLEIRGLISDEYHKFGLYFNYINKIIPTDKANAYEIAFYLLQDTAEALYVHRNKGFSTDPCIAYIEIWGVLQSVIIQQDSISELERLFFDCSGNWCGAGGQIRLLRHEICGHPVNQGSEKKRSFLGRSFGGYDDLIFEQLNSRSGKRTHPRVQLGKLLDLYDDQAASRLSDWWERLQNEF